MQIPVNKYIEIIDSNLLSDIHAYMHTYITFIQELELASTIFQRFVSITPSVDLPHLKELTVNMISNVLSNTNTQQVYSISYIHNREVYCFFLM